MFSNIPNICSPDQPSGFICPSTTVFGTASIIWGVIGPARQFSRGQMYMRRLLYSGCPGWLHKPIPSCTPLIVPCIVPSQSYSSHGLRRVRCSPSPYLQAGKRYSPLCSMSADPVFPRRRKVMPGSSRRRRTFTRASAYVSTTANSACFRMRIPTSSLSRPR